MPRLRAWLFLTLLIVAVASAIGAVLAVVEYTWSLHHP
jgi:hypothetical protein